jgi:nicotinate phosphoribosyltransferase
MTTRGVTRQAAGGRGEGFLFTDMYQLTMAQLFVRQGLAERPALFDYFFRTTPNYGQHKAGYCVGAGLEGLLDVLESVRVGDEELALLRSIESSGKRRLFGDDFLAWLGAHGEFGALGLRAVPEGRVVHPDEPVVIVEGPLAVAQLAETVLINALAYPTLVATKAARIREVAHGGMILEFGTRRGPENGTAAGVRAALVGGADFTSNVAVSARLGLPAKGTHAHSVVQAFIALGGGELAAFRAYAESYPDDCVLLVDTIDTLESGVPNAIRVFEELRAKGHRPVGIRLDSGDLAYLSIEAARMLDRASFPDVAIVLSNQLDELVMWQIVTQIREEAGRAGVDADRLIHRLVWGVGTRLITSHGDPSLDAVYKLVAIKGEGAWVPAIKLSETPAKSLNPGNKRVWRVYDARGKATADVVGLAGEEIAAEDPLVLHHPTRRETKRTLRRSEVSEVEPLLEEVFAGGRRVAGPVAIDALRARRERDVERLDAGVRRLMNPHVYHVSLTDRLWRHKRELIDAVRR